MRIIYRKTIYNFDVKNDDCWFNLDGVESISNNKTLKINADRDVYATIIDGENEIEGYIVSMEDLRNPIPDNFLIDEETYKFKKLRRPGYYL